jgi:hypothetical protein
VVGFTIGSRGEVPEKEKPVIREEIMIILCDSNISKILQNLAALPHL